MEQIIIQNIEFLYEEISSTVMIESAPNVVLMPSPEICQLKTLDSLENAMQAINEFEESTTSNYTVIEKKKDFGNEAFRPTSKLTLHWEGPFINNVSLNEFSGVPFIIVGRKVLGCHLGKDKAIAQKRRYAEAINQREIELMHSALRNNYPAKIYVYHILKFPEFQIAKKTEWEMKEASRKIRDSLEQNCKLNHSYIILFPQPHEKHPVDGEEMLLSHDTCQLKMTDSLENALQTISEFEESTTSNYIVLEKQKDFGNEAFRPTTKFTLHWEGPVINNVSLHEYSGVPFIIVGRKVFGCHFGKDRAAARKRRSAEFMSQTEIIDCPLVKRRKLVMQNTKKKDCPAKIYMYHIMKFPDFQISKKSKWQMKLASKKIRDSLETSIAFSHRYIILFPQFSHHKNHPVDGEEALTKERVDARIIKKITELFESGVSKRRDVKILLDHFVRFELFAGQDIPLNSRRRFFPSLKDIDNIMRRSISKRKSPAEDQSTATHLLT